MINMKRKLSRSLFVLFALSIPTIGFSQKAKPVRSYNHTSIPAPPGMVYIPGGSILVKYGDDSSKIKKYSLSPFFIDKTEVTNRQYREFVNWVIDSVAVTEFLKDEKYFKENSRDSNAKYINWSKVKHKSLFIDPKSDVQGRLQPMYKEGEVRKDLYNFAFKYMKTEKGEKGLTKTNVVESVNVYPDTKVWATDFPNSQTDLMVQEYFTNPAYDDYPVVGVTWKQARAYTYWRTMVSRDYTNGNYLKDFKLPYSLPSEAQWVHAAQGRPGEDQVVDSTGALLRDGKNRLMANFKQEEGNYTEDGASYTVPVMSYAPNDFGVYNMLGNAAEWVLDAYNASAWAFVHDQNPVLLYDADEKDSDFMRSKVVRGGSWKDNGQSLNPYTRNYEVQDVPHSYIGFRCVMAAPELITDKIRTRK